MHTDRLTSARAKFDLLTYQGDSPEEAATNWTYKLSIEPALRFIDTLPPEEGLEALDRLYAWMIECGNEWPIYRWLPVDIDTFIRSPSFLDQGSSVYPRVMHHLRELNTGHYVEAVLTGGIGVAKTTIALWTIAYQLYILSCLRETHVLFNLDKASELVFVIQSVREASARNDYDRFSALIDNSKYFQTVFPNQKSKKTELLFPGRIIVRCFSGSPTAAIGQNVFGGILDEMSFMAVTKQSKASVDGGTFDQANQIYDSIVRRRKSRFMSRGKLPGMLCLVSSPKHPGDFMDLKMEEAREEIRKNGKSAIYVYHEVIWNIKPEGTFSGSMFKLFLGDHSRKPRILEDGEKFTTGEVITVPVEYRSEFERDILSAIRDIAGRSTYAVHPFIVNPDAVAACFGKSASILSLEECDLVKSRPTLYPDRIVNRGEPRFAHLDLALSKDSAGLAIGHVSGFTKVKRADTMTGIPITETLPIITLDCVLEIAPPKNGEIELEQVRGLLYKLRDSGLPIKWVTFDQFQSRDSIQQLRQKGFSSDLQSIDAEATPYEITRTTCYDARLLAPAHPKAVRELVQLERDPETGKIDHPPTGSKDVADAIAGVVYGLTMRREIWLKWQIPLREIPASLLVSRNEVKVA